MGVVVCAGVAGDFASAHAFSRARAFRHGRATYAVIHYGPEHFWSFCLTLAHAFRKSLRFSTSTIGGRGSWSAVSGCVRTRVCLHGELARGLGGAIEFSSTARVPCGQTATLHRFRVPAGQRL